MSMQQRRRRPIVRRVVKCELKDQYDIKLPIDFITDELPKYVDFESILSFIISTKYFYSIYMNDLNRYIKQKSKITDKLNLKRNQYFMYKVITRQPKVLFQAPYGYGKTYIGIKWILDKLEDDSIDFAIIQCPPTAIKTWIAKLVEANLYNANCEKSKVLIKHSSRPKHNKCFNDLKGDLRKGILSKDLPRIILCTGGIEAFYFYFFNIISIEDECHRDYSKSFRTGIREKSKYSLMLTGTSINPESKHTKIQTYEKRDVESNVRIKYVHVNNDLGEIFSYIASKIEEDTKIVICTPKTGRLSSININIVSLFGNKRVFNLLGSERAKNKFEESTNGILLISIASSEAITICAPEVIVVNADNISVQRLGQLFGRFTREETTYNSINIHCITEKPSRIRYASCQLVTDWHYIFKLEQPFECIISICNLVNINYYTCERRDILIVSHMFCIDLDKILAYWNTHKGEHTQLTEEKIRLLFRTVDNVDPYNL